jgi:hypothetical protein
LSSCRPQASAATTAEALLYIRNPSGSNGRSRSHLQYQHSRQSNYYTAVEGGAAKAVDAKLATAMTVKSDSFIQNPRKKIIGDQKKQIRKTSKL